MGKGDIKTKKGKITKGTFGVSRRKKSAGQIDDKKASKKKKSDK